MQEDLRNPQLIDSEKNTGIPVDFDADEFKNSSTGNKRDLSHTR